MVLFGLFMALRDSATNRKHIQRALISVSNCTFFLIDNQHKNPVTMYNVNNPSIKRILREVKEMEAEPSNQYTAAPLEVC